MINVCRQCRTIYPWDKRGARIFKVISEEGHRAVKHFCSPRCLLAFVRKKKEANSG